MREIDTFVAKFVDVIINPLLALIFAAGLLVFLWGLAQFVWRAESEEGRSIGIRHMLWGIVGMFIMAAAWGILQLIGGVVQSFGGRGI